MSICIELFYAKTLGNRVHCTLIFPFFVSLFLEFVCCFFFAQLYAIKYFNLIQIICTQLFGFKYSYEILIIHILPVYWPKE